MWEAAQSLLASRSGVSCHGPAPPTSLPTLHPFLMFAKRQTKGVCLRLCINLTVDVFHNCLNSYIFRSILFPVT